MRVWLFLLGIAIAIVGYFLPEYIHRKRLRKLRLGTRSEITLRDVFTAIVGLRKDIWQVEAIFFGLLLAILVLFL